jgi:hypothetical protein
LLLANEKGVDSDLSWSGMSKALAV